MEQKIQNIIKGLKIGFAIFWLLTIVLFILGEMDVYYTGLYAHNVRACYYFETITILITALFIPVSLKIYSWVLQRRINNQTITIALKQYLLWSSVRLLLLLIVTLIGIFCYYLTLSNTGALCALMGITASFFCVPSEEKLRKELHIDKTE